jgi:DNA-binding NarL/FixJ family response regulator
MEPKHRRLLQRLGDSQALYLTSLSLYEKSFAAAVAGGCRQSDIAIELDLSRQAVHNRITRAQSAAS